MPPNAISQGGEAQVYSVNRLASAVKGIECANLPARSGNRHPLDIILIGAHHDTVFGSPGADANTSGVAALLDRANVAS
jgi:Zn-dependent M28 family amino/carboxypeptidase